MFIAASIRAASSLSLVWKSRRQADFSWLPSKIFTAIRRRDKGVKKRYKVTVRIEDAPEGLLGLIVLPDSLKEPDARAESLLKFWRENAGRVEIERQKIIGFFLTDGIIGTEHKKEERNLWTGH